MDDRVNKSSEYVVGRSEYATEVWTVSATNEEGWCVFSTFSGPGAEERAREYAEWKNSQLAMDHV